MNDWLLRLSMRAFPRGAREQDGEVLLDMARELVAAGSPTFRQAAGLLRAGTTVRFRLAAKQLVGAPWGGARARLALPLAAALLAVALAGAEHATAGVVWIGWSWALALAGATCALAGAALGNRLLTAAGALVVAAMLGLDGVRDLYGSGSRWSVPAGSADVDVLVMWLPAAVLLLACAGAVSPPRAGAAALRLAWAVVPCAALLALTSEQTNAAEAVLVFGGFAIAAALLIVGVIRRATDPPATLASMLVLAAVTPSALWLGAGVLPAPESTALPLLYFAGTGAIAAAGILRLARLASR